MDGWTERSFSKNITAGVDFMTHVAREVAGHYKPEVKQAILLAMLEGTFAMTTSGVSVQQKAAKAFVENHTLDISALEGAAANVGPATHNPRFKRLVVITEHFLFGNHALRCSYQP